MSIYHYTYIIEDNNPPSIQKYYQGVRTSNCLPSEDPYMGSCSDPLYHQYIKTRPHDFVKKIITIKNTRKEAELDEQYYHDKHDVAGDEMYWNRCNANEGFGTSGMVTVKNINTGKTKSMSQSELRESSGEWVANSKGMMCVLDLVYRRSYRIPKEDYDDKYLVSANFEYVYITPWGNYSNLNSLKNDGYFNMSTIFGNLDEYPKGHCKLLLDKSKTYRDSGFDFISYERGINEDLMIKLLGIDVNIPKHRVLIDIEDKERRYDIAKSLGTHTISSIFVTPFGRARRSVFPSFIKKGVMNDTYGNIANVLNVTNWKKDGYYIINNVLGDNDNEMYDDYEEPDIIKDLITLNGLMLMNFNAFSGLYLTPNGVFFTIKEAESSIGNIVSLPSVYRNRLDVKINRHMVDRSKYLNDCDIGKTWKELGFYKIDYIPGINEKRLIEIVNGRDCKTTNIQYNNFKDLAYV
jgi:hypothetical protein